ncbi:MBL fold metallo-hydrolase [Pseudorhodobacter turbinis]|uniref:MBL fold metallo-hydrolase n=1 Tax=Pseudorhodobacter turbinis TaxID=2500533 RepID=A0A4P8EGJ5_9RHOB|nr:MBL fold metallo-hydrolase [Pseudorhodobacter turbinis]QCO55655.1 MBL fold metallo-hydrolase [Pseudorhodobacter turbinis]
MKRRDFLALSAAALALPRAGFAATEMTLPDAKLTMLSDGKLTLPGDFVLGGLDAAEAAMIRQKFGLDPDSYTPPCNLTLYQDGTRNVLFDVGAGPDFMPSAGKLDAALDAVGLTHDDITHVVFTHAHPDHLWGLLDDFDDPKFANAEYLIGRAEFDYWLNPNTVHTIGDARASFAVGAARRLGSIAEQLQFIEDGAEPLPGITARLTPGHTPGHMAFVLGGKVLVTGDAISNNHLAFLRPDAPSPSDQDPDLAATTRVALLDQITADELAIAGFHLPGGLGHATREGDSYTYIEG